MNKVELLKKSKKSKKIELDSILDLDLEQEEYNEFISFLETSGIEIVNNFSEEKNEHENNYEKNSDIYKIYLKEITKYPLLSTEQEIELTRKYSETGSEQIKNILIESNLRLVVSMAKRMYLKYNGAISINDLIQDGNMGLMKAVEKYNIDMKVKLATYATWWIRQSMQRGFAERGRNIRIPAYGIEKLDKLSKYKEAYIREHEKEPTQEECIKALNITKETFLLITAANEDTKSLDADMDYEDSKFTLMDTIPNGENFEDSLVESIKNEGIWEVVKSVLTKREYDILLSRFGKKIGDCGSIEIESLEKIGKRYSLTRERVRTIQLAAERKLTKSEKMKKYR